LVVGGRNSISQPSQIPGPLCATLIYILRNLNDLRRYEILDGLPVYGPMYISVTHTKDPFYSEGYAVRFYKADQTSWVANFQPGWTLLKSVIDLINSSNVLVIAYGSCYVMNPDDTQPVSVFGVDYHEYFLSENGKVVLQGQTDLTIVEPNGDYWITERISWDGLKELKLENNILIGLSYDPMNDADEWMPFEYNIDKKILTGGSYNRHQFGKKSWWKF